ncbi:pseudouridine synthase [Dyadobacter luticola]|uniref:Pseudouridine synthase n=1 Tax=Dyadobacter luticola TaxID=1979387 RepID=A0A5R9KVG7_9BACT|nr:pseudouridine synthase [Dyadobacter luticola]TLV00057.1 pseudouridine synthase [Dyadobacter luticola]
MRKRTTPGGGGSPFKKAKPAVESRFSKPSIKKSSLRVTGQTDNKAPKSRPSFDHEKPKNERPRFDKPEFRKFGSDRPDRGPSRPFKREGDSRGGDDRRDSGRSTPDRYAKTFKPREEFGSREFKPREESKSREFKPREDRRQDEGRTFGDRPERPRFEKGGDSREFKPREDRRSGEGRTFGDRPERSRFDKGGDSREFKPREDRGQGEGRSFGDRPERPRFEKGGDSREFKPRENVRLGSRRPFGDKPAFKKKDEIADSDEPGGRERAPRNEEDATGNRSGLDRRVGRFESAPRYNLADYEKKGAPKNKEESDEIRLNRYIANAGICSRREADELISSGQISVNGKTITEMGYKVKPTDVVKYGKKALNREKMVYILINKPKDYITTTDDPEERKTVLDLIAGACSERVYPVGRLDRNTTGLLLLTNDGELAEKLTHPSGGIKKIYQAELDKPITTEDFELLQAGVALEDGFIRPDEVGIVTPDAMVVGLEIHSGRNRIVRRMFEHLGYEVQKLDRTVFAGLNKKDLPRGKWRFLSEKEVIKLKFLL